MIKITANSFLAMKISFINSIASICEAVGADIRRVAEGVGTDRRIGQDFLQAGIGYGGSCFPKDTLDLLALANQHSLDFDLLQSTIRVNEIQPFRMIEKLLDYFGEIDGRKIAVLGLAFKPSTSDVRMAPSLKIINELLVQGANVQVYDPVAMSQIQEIFQEQIAYCPEVYSAVQYCDAAVIVTEWNDIVEADIARIVELMKHPVLIDGRNCLSYEQLKDLNVFYAGIGIPVINNYKLLQSKIPV